MIPPPDAGPEPSPRLETWSDSTAMGTTVHVCAVGDDPAALKASGRAAHATVAEVDAALSRFRPDSDVGRLNAAPGGWLPVGPHFIAVADAAERYRELTRGVFDATLPAPGSSAPGSSTTGLSGGARMRRRAASGGGEAWLAPGHRIDFGAIAKGYAADLARDRAWASTVAGVLVSLGTSSIAMGGAPARRDAWRIALSSPWEALTETLGYVETAGGSFSLSGARGVRIGADPLVARHVTDPRTRRPAGTDVCAVGVLSEDAMHSEALSTASLVLGLDQGMALCREHGADAVFLTVDGRILATAGMAPRIRLRTGVRRRLSARARSSPSHPMRDPQ